MHRPNLPMWMMLAAMATTGEETPGPKQYTPGSTPPKRKARAKPAPLPPADPDAVARAMAIPPHETRAQRREREQIARAREVEKKSTTAVDSVAGS